MKEVVYALGIGAISGSRSMLAPALAMNVGRRRAGAGGTLMALLAAAEMVADKSPSIPSRTEPVPAQRPPGLGRCGGRRVCASGHRLTAIAAGAAVPWPGLTVFITYDDS